MNDDAPIVSFCATNVRMYSRCTVFGQNRQVLLAMSSIAVTSYCIHLVKKWNKYIFKSGPTTPIALAFSHSVHFGWKPPTICNKLILNAHGTMMHTQTASFMLYTSMDNPYYIPHMFGLTLNSILHLASSVFRLPPYILYLNCIPFPTLTLLP